MTVSLPPETLEVLRTLCDDAPPVIFDLETTGPDRLTDRIVEVAALKVSPDGTVTVFETTGLPVVSVIASSEDDWDRYETLHWKAVEGWLAESAGDPDAAEVREWHEREKRTYLRHGRDYLGWAIFVGWKRP